MKFKLPFFFLLTTIAAFSAFAQNASDSESRVVTLFGKDPIGNSLCFKDNGAGSVLKGTKIFNRCSDLNFDSYSANGLSVGVEGGREGAIIDLGTAAELKKRYGYDETVGNGQGFASISFVDGKLSILKNYRSQTMQPLTEGTKLFDKVDSGANAIASLGHIYLIRITDRGDKSYEEFAKVIVIGYKADESVTIRWSPIPKQIPSTVGSLVTK